MTLYCGIDLHSTNSYLVVLDEKDRVLLNKRVSNDLESVLGELEPFRDSVSAVAIESTFNWYWLADGLEDHGYEVQLVNPYAAKQYEGPSIETMRTTLAKEEEVPGACLGGS